MPLKVEVCQTLNFSYQITIARLWLIVTELCLVRGLRGILLYGVKGVGKSLLAQAVAIKSGAHVINIGSQQALLWYLVSM